MLLPAVAALVLLAPAVEAPGAWRVVAPGVEHATLAAGETDLLRFDLARFRPDVIVPGAGAPLTAAHARVAERAICVVNGGFFDTDGRPLGLRIGGGKVIQGLRRRVDWGVLLVRAGRASIVHSRDYAFDPAVTAAIQVGPRVLVGGVVPQLKPQSSRRTAVAVDASGRTLTVVVTRARISAAALGEALAGLGFSDALLLDGGPSTQLSAVVGDFSLEVPGGYAVPDLLVIR